MSDKRYLVLEQMIDAIMADTCIVAVVNGKGINLTRPTAKEIARRVLRWQSENRTLPDEKVVRELLEDSLQYWFVGDTALKKEAALSIHTRLNALWSEHQRLMFLAPEPEVDRVDFFTKGSDGAYRPFPPTEAQDEMRKYFDTAFGRFEIDNRVPPGEIRLHNWSGPTLLKVDAPVPEVEVVVIETKLGNRFRCTVKDGMIQSAQYYGHDPDAPHCGESWPRRIVEPEVPEQIKDLLLVDIREGFFKPEVINERMAECYRRGQKAGAK